MVIGYVFRPSVPSSWDRLCYKGTCRIFSPVLACGDWEISAFDTNRSWCVNFGPVASLKTAASYDSNIRISFMVTCVELWAMDVFCGSLLRSGVACLLLTCVFPIEGYLFGFVQWVGCLGTFIRLRTSALCMFVWKNGIYTSAFHVPVKRF